MPLAVPFVARPDHLDRLTRAGLSSLDECRAFAGGDVVKALRPGRSTVRIEAGGWVYYLKRIAGPGVGEVANEARLLGLLGAMGLPVAEVAAVGADEGFGALITVGLPVRGTLEQEVAGGAQAVDLWRRRRQVGAILRSLHAAGVQHRDFYLTHLLVGEGGGLFVADFGRARLRPRLGWLKRIKDLAALDFSTPGPAASDWARLRFLREYAGRPGRWRLKLVARLVRSKARVMRRHVERQIARLRPNYHLSG